MTARDVIERHLNQKAGLVLTSEANADAILAALDTAGYAPPLHTGAIHRALQDAFQAGVNEAFAGRYIRPSADIIALKHKICDGILHGLTAAKETTSQAAGGGE